MSYPYFTRKFRVKKDHSSERTYTTIFNATLWIAVELQVTGITANVLLRANFTLISRVIIAIYHLD